jgi:hypothetical protein
MTSSPPSQAGRRSIWSQGELINTLVNNVPAVAQFARNRVTPKDNPTSGNAVSGVPAGPYLRSHAEHTPAPAVAVQSLQVRYDAVFDEYTRAELDPKTLLEGPAILDVGYPTTAAFHDALSAAQNALEADPVNPAAEEAVEVMESAWVTAMDAAYEVGVNGMDMRKARRMDGLWATATAPAGVSDTERRKAIDAAKSYLSEVRDAHGVHLSGERIVSAFAERAELDHVVRPALTVGPD